MSGGTGKAGPALASAGQGGFVHPAWGSYLALLSSLAMIAGAAMANRDNGPASEPVLTASRHPAYPPAPAPAPTPWVPDAAAGPAMTMATDPAGPLGGPADTWSSTHSVPPPGR